jgi:Ca2+-binding RTX toxin-like protein
MVLVRLLGCALALLLVVPAAARAGVVTVTDGVLRFTGTPGESEWVSVHNWDGEVMLSDGSAAIIAGAGCRQSSVVVCGGVQRLVLETGDGADRVTLSNNVMLPAEVDLGPGKDIVVEGGTRADIQGGEGDDWIVSYDAGTRSTFDGGPGRDEALYDQRWGSLRLSLDGQANDGAPGEGDTLLGVEVIHGGFDDDVITGGPGADVLYGGMGTDEIHGLAGDDTLDAWSGDLGDRLYGGEGKDVMQLSGAVVADGGPGDDTFTRGAWSSCAGCTAIGGPGADTVDFSDHSFGPTRISLDDLPNDGDLGGTANVRSDIENLLGPRNAATLIGSSGPNRIVGGEGDDVLIGGGGTDKLIGRDGFDTADYSTHAAPLTLTLDGRANDGAVGESDLIESDVEALRGGAGADVLVGDTGDNLLDGGLGADRITGGGGLDGADYSLRTASVRVRLDGMSGSGEAGDHDSIAGDVEGAIGGAGDDRLIGNALDGYLLGEDGDDVLLDRGGNDELDGGAGADQLDSYDGQRDEIDCGEGEDRLWSNSSDRLGATCETVFDTARPADPEPTPTATPTPSATPTPTPVAPAATATPEPITPPAADRTAPRVIRMRHPSSLGRAVVRKRGLEIRVRCDEPCRVRADLTRNGRVLATATRTTPSRALRTLRLRLTASGKRSSLRGTFRLELTLTDLAGNTSTKLRTVRLR